MKPSERLRSKKMFDWNEELNKILDEHHARLEEDSDWNEEKTNDLIARGKRERTEEIVEMIQEIPVLDVHGVNDEFISKTDLLEKIKSN